MSPVAVFSSDYHSARQRFRDAATKLGWALEAHPIDAFGPGGQDLTIDAAYCVTYEAFSGFTYDYTVGEACRQVILRNLTAGYFRTITPGFKQAYLALETPVFLRDRTTLKRWCEARREKKLYELQIEICERTATDLVASEKLFGVNLKTREEWSATIQRAAQSLRETQTAVRWKGFGLEEVIPYSRRTAEVALRTLSGLSLKVEKLPRATVDEMVEITIVVSNTGEIPLHGVRVFVQLPEQLKHRWGSEVESTIADLPVGGSEKAVLRVLAQSTGRATCRLHVTADEPTEAAIDASLDVVGSPDRFEKSKTTRTEPAHLKPIPAPIRTGTLPNSNCCCQPQPALYEAWFIP